MLPQSSSLMDVTVALTGIPAISKTKLSPNFKDNVLAKPFSIDTSGMRVLPCHVPAVTLFLSGNSAP